MVVDLNITGYKEYNKITNTQFTAFPSKFDLWPDVISTNGVGPSCRILFAVRHSLAALQGLHFDQNLLTFLINNLVNSAYKAVLKKYPQPCSVQSNGL